MCRFIETIKIKDGMINNRLYHNERLNKTRKEVLGCKDILYLEDYLQNIPESSGIIKCRIVYSKEIENVNYEIYKKREINSLKIIFDDNIEYGYKYLDRKCIDKLLLMKDAYDEIIIVKNGKLTDSSFSNLVFSDGNKLLTPADPILKGTKRHQLLDEKRIVEEEITIKDLKYFEKVCLINAMLDIEDNMSVPVKNISLN